MPAVIIKSDERREHEAHTLQSFVRDKDHATAEQRDAACTIANKAMEQIKTLQNMEERYK